MNFASDCLACSHALDRTGLKVLPHSKLPVHGDVLHDSHAEVIARRGLKLWLFDQLEKAYTQDPSAALERDATGVWVLRPGLHLALYISTLPCKRRASRGLSGCRMRSFVIGCQVETLRLIRCLWVLNRSDQLIKQLKTILASLQPCLRCR